ncbi:hypothetical protein WUBG_04465 [Wuchereria bancrofti]|uniref:Tetratricopeptide repeat protein n=1 Tax=Wuchereria bancrofti TaxID=6293 RepID=J9EQ55_WUCBA|nr:hypothetical protein WUBG_04465 [Wuchereria bancrofti]VDM19217.1 unnamed protein product [Wuchereria bancrofti]
MQGKLLNWYSFIFRKQSLTALVMFPRIPRNHGRTGGRGKSNWGQKGWRWFTGSTAFPLLGFSMITTFKDLFGTPPFQLDKDPLKHKIKEAWLYRKEHNYDQAVMVLEEAMQIATGRNNELIVSRIIDELANTYYEMGKLDEAEQAFRDLLQRLMILHTKKDYDPEFIDVSLKLSDIFAQKGKLDDAEIGYKHCVARQMKVVEKHMAKYSINYGGSYDIPQVVNQYGAVFTDPLALYGLCLEQYAHFIARYREEKRIDDTAQLIDEALKISYQIYGINCSHTINMLNNYSALLIDRNRFDLAKKYLEIGIDRILYIDECSSLLPGYYCNYSEALYHCGQRVEALQYAKKAVNLSQSESKELRNYTTRFLQDMEKDYKRHR